ncbi:hypothetical protein [Streptomyces sp. L2]|uniref:hypothetical protein n=1 Tax=Streptomyces sp. L2 TaxID=2162665 RepID=UPI0010115943|nr:hypothetical protein [Streptomyces sp. L2]
MRGADRAPQILSEKQRSEAVALWSWGSDDVDGRQHTVVYIEPLRPNAPLPPGLTRWPEPGEAVLSPALLKAGSREGIGTRYGTFAGTIGSEGLEAPEERFAYVRPRAQLLDRKAMHPVRGFGSSGGGIASLGESMSIPDFSVFAAGLAGFALMPALVFLLAGVRIGSAARERRLALFDALGAGAISQTVFTLGEVAVPTACGLAGATGLISPTLLTDVPFPWTDFTLSAQDARRALPWLVVAGAVTLVLVLVTAVVLHPRRRADSGSTRPAPRFQRQRGWVPWLFPFAMLFAVRGSELAGDDLRLPVYALGVAAVLLTLPSTIAVLTGWAGVRIAKTGSKLGRPGMLIAGRRLAAQTRVTARLVAAVVVMIGVAAQAQLWTGLLGENAVNATATRDRIGTSLLVVSPLPDDKERVRDFAGALPAGVQLLLVESTSPSDSAGVSTRFTGSCTALKALKLPCDGKTGENGSERRVRDPRIAQFLRWTGSTTAGRITVRQGRVDDISTAADESSTLIAVDKSGADMSMPRLREIARAHLDMRANAEPLGNSWLLGAKDLEASAAWVRLLGLVGACLTVLAIGFTTLAEFRRFGREVAPLSALAGGYGIFGSIAAWSLLFPTVLAAAVGSTISMWLTAPITVGGRQPVPDSLYLVLAVGASTSAALLCLWGWRSATRVAVSWRPVAD